MNNNYLDTTKVTLDPIEGDTEEVLRLKLIALANSSRQKMLWISRYVAASFLCMAIAICLMQDASNPHDWLIVAIIITMVIHFLVTAIKDGLTIQQSYETSAEALSSALGLVVEPQLADKS